MRPEVRSTPAYQFTPIDAPFKLDQNESALDFPLALRRLAVERILARDWNRYPDLHAEMLKARIGTYEGWNPEGVVVTPGTGFGSQGEGFFRISLTTPTERLRQAMQRLSELPAWTGSA